MTDEQDPAGYWEHDWIGRLVFRPYDEPREYTDLEPIEEDSEAEEEASDALDSRLTPQEEGGYWDTDWLGRTVWRRL